MTRSAYDLTYGEIDLGVLNTNAKARTGGSGLYVSLWQTGKSGSSHILLFPEQIQPMIDFLIEQQKAARKADHSRDNAKRKLMEVHGFDAMTTHVLLLDAEENGVAQFVSEKVFENAAKTRRMRYTLQCEWSGELDMDEYIIQVETTT